MSMPVMKSQQVDSSLTAVSYDMAYQYEDPNHPSAPSQIGHEHYTYDANGNPVLVENDSTSEVRELYWDEDNRLMVLSDNGKTSRYTYNHSSERIVKSHGTMEGVYINGAPQGITFHETDEFTLYPASIISVSKNRYTKHYFIGSKRVASRIGSGHFNNVYGMNGCNITAGQQDYAERLNQIESQKEDYYKKLGIAPGIPTMKGSYGDPENTGVGYNTIIRNLGDHSVPTEWAEYVKKNENRETAPGAPIAWEKASQPEEVQPGYGYVADNNGTEETFYYHSDHLGSTSYVTDDSARITQYTAYLPYGELLVDEHSSSEDMPYKFNGKELDEETGLYYYGARYMQPIASVWYGIDSKFEKYPSLSGYCITSANPIILKDIDGNDIVLVGTKNSSVKIKTDLLNCRVSIADYGVDFRGNFTFNGDELVSAALDIVGIVDPSGTADAANACLQFKNKDYLGATISGIGLVPYAGDAAKIFKVGKDIKIIKKAISVIQRNRIIGKSAEKQVTAQIRKLYGKGAKVGEQITARFKDGSKVVFDNVVVENGTITFINETKSGGAKLSQQQLRFFEGNEAVTFVGKKADVLNIKGKTIQASKVETKVSHLEVNEIK